MATNYGVAYPGGFFVAPVPKAKKPKQKRCKAHKQFGCSAHTCR